jgi:hypothetical protein
MKNKPILSLILWLSALVLGSYFLISSFKNNEIKAIEESSLFLKDASFEVNKSSVDMVLEDLSPLTHVRDIYLFSSIDKGFSLADSLYRTDKIEWELLHKHFPNSHFEVSEEEWRSWTPKQKEENNIDENDVFIYEKRTALNYNSKKEEIKMLHKLWLYESYIEIWKKTLFSIGYQRIHFDRFHIADIDLRGSKLALIYSNTIHTSEQNYIKSGKSRFTNHKDTIIFYPKFDAFSTDYKGENKPYFKIKVRKGQKYNFEITKLENEK